MKRPTELDDDAVRSERQALACFLEPNPPEIETGLADHCLIEDHRKLVRAAVELRGKGQLPDLALLADVAGVPFAYVADLQTVPCVVRNFPEYVNRIRNFSRERQYAHLYEELGTAAAGDRPRILARMQESLQGSTSRDDWRTLFHSFSEFENAPKLQFAIDGFLQEGGATLIAALAGQGKTFAMLAMTRALLDCEPLFGYFEVRRPSKRVIYLVPESTIAPFWARVQLFHLEEHIRSERLLIQTLSAKERVLLTDPRLLSAANESDIFLDTVARFTNGTEDIEDARALADSLFGLLRAGARTITAAHHSPKGFEHADYMCLENMVRGSGDFGAAICTAWGLRQIDAVKNRAYVKNLKPRDFLPCEPFILQGRPSIDERGCFDMPEPPGFAGELKGHLPRNKGGRPQLEGRDEKREQVLDLKAEGMSERDIAVKVGISASTVHRLIHSHALQNQ